MESNSRPRARTVFEVVEERHGDSKGQETTTEVLSNPLWQLTNSAARRELDRFAALLGVFAAHIMTSPLIWPVSILVVKGSVGAALFSVGSLAHFTWVQATVLTGGLGLAGPLFFFLYRYWSGKF